MSRRRSGYSQGASVTTVNKPALQEQPRSRVLAIVPARGGSKGISRKNVRLLAGKPLINYTIEAALQSQYQRRVVVSTDDKEIAKIAQAEGAEVPFLRPTDLARDETPTFPVVQHALQWLEQHEVIVWSRKGAATSRRTSVLVRFLV